MTSLTQTTTTWAGHAAVTLEDSRVRVVVLPACGGKIASLLDLNRGREWLFRNPHLPISTPEYGGDYVGRFDSGGFDECFPNITAGPYPTAPWAGTPLPDHGEVWGLPWRSTLLENGLHMSVHGVRLPYTLSRTLTLPGNGRIHLAYTLENHTPFALPFIWSSHPLLAVRPGMQIDVPAQQMWVYGGNDQLPATPSGAIIDWPRHAGRDLSVLPPADSGIAIKLYSVALTGDALAVRDPADGAALHMRFDATTVTHVGLWLNHGGWAGAAGASPYYNIGVEPCIGHSDDLAAAHAAGSAGRVPAGKTLHWWLELTVA